MLSDRKSLFCISDMLKDPLAVYAKAEEMAARIGKEYVLTYYSPKLDCEEDSIDLGGVLYPLVKQSPNEFEYTEIVEVDYAF